MSTLILCILVELIALGAVIVGGALLIDALLIVGLVVLCVAWIPLLGLRILKPHEALVLTLFGKYVGTIKGEGFYSVHLYVVKR